MRQREVRRRAIRQYHLLHEGLNVDFVVGEMAHVTLAPVTQLVLRMALSAPVDDSHGKTAVAQIAHGFEIFFDLLAASGKHADSSFSPRRRGPACKAQSDSVG